MSDQHDVLDDLRKAADRREQLADAHAKKATHLREEAREFRLVATRIQQKLGKGPPVPAPTSSPRDDDEDDDDDDDDD